MIEVSPYRFNDWAPTTREKWFMEMTDLAAKRSGDSSSQFGAVITSPDHVIRSVGWNDLPRKVADKPERRERPGKYLWTEHAERNAIYNAARSGVSTQGCTLYVNGPPCADCARAMIQAGIRILFCYKPDWSVADYPPDNWRAQVWEGFNMMAEAGVDIRFVRATPPL